MKILYGVPGEGMGHATRSKVVIDYLLKKKHDVQVVSSDRAYHFLNTNFPGRVYEIKGLHFAFKDAQVSKLGTLLLNLKKGPQNILFNYTKYLTIEKNFKPDLVISDFESFAFLFAKSLKIPVISIDNMQVMDRCVLDIAINPKEKSNYQLAKSIVKAKVPGCEHYLISSFFKAEVRKKNTTLVPPIIREAILNAKVSAGNHVLMYQTSSSITNVKEVLHSLPAEKFLVYGFNKEEADGNVQFKKFSEEGFVKDLASAKAVIANGGFSFISEAVYLQKPVYSFPLQNQFEQWMNAAYVNKCGYGRHFDTLDADCLKSFLYDLDVFRQNLLAYKQQGNGLLFKELETLLAQVQTGSGK